MTKEKDDDLQRTGFWVNREWNARFDAIVPHGFKSEILRSLMIMAVELLEEHGHAALGLLAAGRLSLTIKKEDVPSGGSRIPAERSKQDVDRGAAVPDEEDQGG